MTETTTRHEWTTNGVHGIEYHDAEGRLHREDGPALTLTFPDSYQREEWWEGDKLHRKDGPAVTTTNRDGSKDCEWWEDGKYIRSEWTPAPKDSDATVGAADEE